MLTKDDKKFLTENFATKKESSTLRDAIDLLRSKITELSLDRFHSNSRLDSIEAASFRTEEKIDKILNIVDGYAGKIADLGQENKMGARTLHRHDTQIHELATATSTTISE